MANKVAIGNNRDLKVFFLILTGCVSFLIICNPASAATYTVCPTGCNFSSVQEAIDYASSGDTIQVFPGNYPEAIEVDRALTIRGTGGIPVIGDADEDASVLVTANGVVLEDLKISTGQRWSVEISGDDCQLLSLDITGHDSVYERDPAVIGKDIAGISIEGCTVQSEEKFCIILNNADRTVVKDCNIVTGTNVTQLHTAVVFLQEKAETGISGPIIVNNTMHGGGLDIGILSPVSDILVKGNKVTESDTYGISLFGKGDTACSNLTVSQNTISYLNSINPSISISGLSEITIENNVVDNSWRGGDGFNLRELDAAIIKDNLVRDGQGSSIDGTAAFCLETTTNSVVSGNTVTGFSPFAYYYAPGPNFSPNLSFDATNTADGKPVLFYEGASGVTVDGESIAMVVLLSCSDMEIKDCTIEKTGLGVGVYGCSGTTISGNEILSANSGIMLIQTTDSVVEGNTFDGSWFAIGIGDNANAHVHENTFSNYLDSGVVIHTGDSEDVTITGNTFYGTLGNEQAICSSDSVADGVIVSDNRCLGNDRGFLIDFTKSLTVTDNIIQDCGVGINLIAAQENYISGNTITSTDEDFTGLFLFSNTSLFDSGAVRDNWLYNNYVESVTPLNITSGSKNPFNTDREFGAIWGPEIEVGFQPKEGDPLPRNYWNVEKRDGTNIVGGPYIGGNYWATPNGSGWSQVTPDRGDGFCNAPFVYDTNNTDYLPLHFVGQPFYADFTAEPVTGDAPLTVSFTDVSDGDPIQFLYDFGDGATSRSRNPEHIYRSPGTYTVGLTIWRIKGSSLEKTATVKEDLIAVGGEPAPGLAANFTTEPVTGDAPLTVSFTDTSTGNPTLWKYDFGDGATSTSPNPDHRYMTPGTYTVSLTVYAIEGTSLVSDTIMKEDLIVVEGTPVPPISADFTAEPESGAAPLTVSFTDASTGDPSYWKYDFGDGICSYSANPKHTYRLPGTYTVKLTVTGFGPGHSLIRSSVEKPDLITVGSPD